MHSSNTLHSTFKKYGRSDKKKKEKKKKDLVSGTDML